MLEMLERPRLLIAAARHALRGYKRETGLKRVLSCAAAPGPAQASLALMALEGEMEEARRSGAVTYQPSRHIALLTALMAEARCLEDQRAKSSPVTMLAAYRAAG